MSSTLEGRSENENQKNLERFTPLMYQMKGQSGGSGQTRSRTNDIVGQEPGCYPYPTGDHRISSNEGDPEQERILNLKKTATCFKPQKLL